MSWKGLPNWLKIGIILSILYFIFIIGDIYYTQNLCKSVEGNMFGGLCALSYLWVGIPWVFIFGFSALNGNITSIYVLVNFILLFLIPYLIQKIFFNNKKRDKK